MLSFFVFYSLEEYQKADGSSPEQSEQSQVASAENSVAADSENTNANRNDNMEVTRIKSRFDIPKEEAFLEVYPCQFQDLKKMSSKLIPGHFHIFEHFICFVSSHPEFPCEVFVLIFFYINLKHRFAISEVITMLRKESYSLPAIEVNTATKVLF